LILGGLATCDDSCQCRLIADDPDLVVVDFNLRDDGLEVNLSGLGKACSWQVVPRCATGPI
jgi:hypothetical protein